MSDSSTYKIALAVPRSAVPTFEALLETLEGALVAGGPDHVGLVPLDLYVEGPPDAARLDALLRDAAQIAGVETPNAEVELLPETDWVAKSYASLPPIRAGRCFIHGSHFQGRPPAGSIHFLIDANRAFGTGVHETTRGCLLALQDLQRRGFPARRILDLGTGSGILAFTAATLWREKVVASDIDAPSVEVAADNARLNGVRSWIDFTVADGYRAPAIRKSAPYDLIICNILAEPLNSLSGQLVRHLRPGGHAILSGLLAHQEQRVLRKHRAMGLKLVRRIRIGDWPTLIIRR